MQMCYTGGKDSFNRGVVWLRFKFHNPTESSARDLCRLAATVMLDALKDPDVQRYGIVIIQVCNLENLSHAWAHFRALPEL